MATYSLTAGTVTSPFCPASWQAVLNEYAQRLSLEIPSINGFIAQTSTPSASDQDKVWIKTSASAPYVLGAYVYQGGAWRLIPAPATATYFVDTGAANTWTISTGESIPDNAAYITGRLWVIRVAANVTGATTLQIDSFTAKAVKKQNDQDLVSGDVEAEQLVLVAYDATSSQFELLTTLGEQSSPYKAAIVKKDGAAGTAVQTISSNTETTVEFGTKVDPDGFITSLSGNQVTLPAGYYIFDITVPLFRLGSPGAPKVVIMLRQDSSTYLAYGTGYNAGGGGDASFVNIKYPVKTTAASTVFDVRVYSKDYDVDLGVSANASTYNETFQQWSIIKIA